MAKLTEPKREGERTIQGLNFFARTEQALLRALQRPEFNIHGLRRANVKPFVDLSDSALSRQLHRLRALGLIKRVSRSYRYYLTRWAVPRSPPPARSRSSRSCPHWRFRDDNFFANPVKTSVVRD